MPRKGDFNREYAIYNNQETLLFIGNIQECADYIGRTRKAVYCLERRLKEGCKPREYQVVRMDEDQEDE